LICFPHPLYHQATFLLYDPVIKLLYVEYRFIGSTRNFLKEAKPMTKLLTMLGLVLATLSFSGAQADQFESYATDEAIYDTPASDEYTAESDYELMQRNRNRREFLLGQATMPQFRSQVTFNTRSCQDRRNGRVDRILVEVFNADLNLHRILVQFGNGRWQTLGFRGAEVRRGSNTGWLNVGDRGGANCIRRIVVDGDSDNSDFPRMAQIRIWARR
jgi:hypothetical protein